MKNRADPENILNSSAGKDNMVDIQSFGDLENSVVSLPP
jgi:hypothetical protein